MSQYYDNSQWPAGGQNSWDQTPPARSGASSAVPREEPAAFLYQLEEVDRAIDNLQKSGKMFGGMPGGPRPPRMGPGAGPRQHPGADYGDQRGHSPSANLQNFYASQRHQTSRGSNEAEQMMQAKRRMAAQRERELRNYHQEQQFNRTVQAEITGAGGYAAKPDRTLSPGGMSEDERRELIARQRNALYGEGPYVDETGTPQPGMPGRPHGPSSLRGHSPLAFDYGRAPPAQTEAVSQQTNSLEAGPGSNDQSRTNNAASPQPNQPQQQQQPISRTSVSSPGGSGGSPPLSAAPGGKAGQGSAVAPIGTRPVGQRSSPPMPTDGGNASGGQANPAVSTAGNLSGGWPGRSSALWGSNNSGMGAASPAYGPRVGSSMTPLLSRTFVMKNLEKSHVE